MTGKIQSIKCHTEDGAVLNIATDEGEKIVPVGEAPLNAEIAAWLEKGGEIAPYYTITAAEYANAEGTAIWARTEEAGRVLVTQSPGKADRWAALQKWVAAGGVIAPYVAPTREQRASPAAELAALKRLMVEKGVATETEIEAAIEAAGEPDYVAASDEVAAEVLGR